MSRSPSEELQLSPEHPYAQAASQLNKLIRSGRSFSGHERNVGFVNLGTGGYVNASSVLGLDFAEDGRAIAQADWDGDGDLDFWVANRTAPQLRFMRNQLQTQHHYIAFALVGTQSNRDAIGAQVQLRTADGELLTKSVRGGEGYLAQSSKRLHFGLGHSDSITQLAVRWPNGIRERFAVPTDVDRSFRLVERSGKPEPMDMRQRANASGIVASPSVSSDSNNKGSIASGASSLATHNLLTEPVPLPPLYATEANARVDLTQLDGAARLVNLWAPWCTTCIAEQSEWMRGADQLQAAGVELVLVNVEPLEDAPPQGTANTSQHANGFKTNRFRNVAATPELVETLQHVHNVIYDHHRALPIPTSVLIDATGRLAAIYKGPVSLEVVLADLYRHKLTGTERMDAALPFKGRWLAALSTARLSRVVTRLWDDGFDETAIEYARRLANANERWRAQAPLAMAICFERLRNSEREAEAINLLAKYLVDHPRDVEANFRLGTFFLERGDLRQAIGLLTRAASENSKSRAEVHANLGAALRQAGQLPAARRHLRIALSIDRRLVEAANHLALLEAGQGELKAAVDLFELVVEQQPTVNHRVNFANALARVNRVDEACDQLRFALEADPQSVVARVYLAETLVQGGRHAEAIQEFLRVVGENPDAGRIWLRLAQLNLEQTNDGEALRCYGHVSRLQPTDALVMREIAWILATTSRRELQNGERAVKLAKASLERQKTNDYRGLDVLAAAYAAAGRYSEAVATAEKSLEFAGKLAADSSRISAEIRKRLELYRQGSAYRRAGG